MARKAAVQRELKRKATVAKYASRRLELKQLAKKGDQDAIEELQKLPRDASPTRLHNRCNLTGRPRGNYRKFGISRIKFRELAHRGHLPGVRKSSW